MADGSIIEFALAAQAEPVAGVCREPIGNSVPAEMQAMILGRLFDRYAEEQGIEATPSEINDFIEKMKSGMAEKGQTAGDDLTAEEWAKADAMQIDLARSIILRWKINKSLYQKYSGHRNRSMPIASSLRKPSGRAPSPSRTNRRLTLSGNMSRTTLSMTSWNRAAKMKHAPSPCRLGRTENGQKKSGTAEQ